MALSDTASQLNVVDVQPFLNNPDSPQALEQCYALLGACTRHRAVLVKDTRVEFAALVAFQGMMINFFRRVFQLLREGVAPEGLPHVRPDLFYQVGLTPPKGEFCRRAKQDWVEWVSSWDPADRPLGLGPLWDPKLRWFEPVCDPKHRRCEPESPQANWHEICMGWARYEIQTLYTLAEMLAVGMGLPQDHFLNGLKRGVHLLAPTGMDLSGELTTPLVVAGTHYDLNWGTLHGPSTLPGLWIWTIHGQKLLVRVPPGHLLFQVGRQLAIQTSGLLQEGFHEVVITDDLLPEIRDLMRGNKSPIRTTSTLFGTLAGDVPTLPHGMLFGELPQRMQDVVRAHYPEIDGTAEDQIMGELAKIAFAKGETP